MSEAAIDAALQEENQSRCSPPLCPSEVSRIAASVSRYDPDPDSSAPVHTRASLAERIDKATDVDALIGSVASEVMRSELGAAEKELLLKAISKKTGVSLGSLREDERRRRASADRPGGGPVNHLAMAVQAILHFGEGNLVHAQGSLWGWRCDGVWKELEDRVLQKIVHELAAGHALTANIVKSIVDLAMTEVFREDLVFDADHTTINCITGELKFADGRWHLLPHERDHFHTTMIPVAYDPAATAPRFEQFLGELFDGDPDAADKAMVVIEALGYTLTTSCRLEKFFMLVGSGANGKSVLLSVVADLVGSHHVSAVQPNQFDNRFQRAHLHGKLANIITEIAEGAEIHDAQLKSLVTGEMNTAEHKHKDPFEFTPFAKHWFGTNHMPHTRDFSDALFRRGVILPFNNKFEGALRDVHLPAKLKAELPGILNLALEGLKRLNERNAFTECASSVEAIKQWRLEADQVAQFVEEVCEIGSEHSTTSDQLYREYDAWADGAGIRRKLNRKNFALRLARLGCSLARGAGGVRMIAGIRRRPLGGSQAGVSSIVQRPVAMRAPK
jgi:putative DNA primase/helicase